MASQYIGGYKSLASALRIVWQLIKICKARLNIFVFEYFFIFPQFTLDAFEPRTRSTHSMHCASLNGPLSEHFSTTYGVNRDSIVNSSRWGKIHLNTNIHVSLRL